MSNVIAGMFLPAGSSVEPQPIFVEDYKSIQSLVGGNFDCVRTDMGQPDVALVGYVHDEGLLLDLEYNFLATALFKQELHGDCVVVWGLSPNGFYDGENYDIPSHISDYLSKELLEATSSAYNMATSVSFALGYAISMELVTEEEVENLTMGLFESKQAKTSNRIMELRLSEILKMVVDHAKENMIDLKEYLGNYVQQMVDEANADDEEV